MRFLIVTNLDKNNAESCTRLVVSKLLSLGGAVGMEPVSYTHLARKWDEGCCLWKYPRF